ncbi:glutathione peroxidase [Sphingomonas sp. H39-1-10]|uniref:glutathione peroxidase n=1 Tax=Sphingomonas pollutisoli TaxID=3030829 RepID=UPI0023B8FDEA|nr:glutathione peroxidase [Sphingomonas pollutisoli]MDF0487414.1 glutathione peroxidase [Sphingomonas pollutisoli]
MTTLLETPLKTIDGQHTSLAQYAGDVLLVVNVASKCGLTPQYEGLEALYRQYRERGFKVLGFPANDFAGQEPGGDAEIADFCKATYDVDFPMFSKIAVTGPGKHPLYAALIAAAPDAAGDAEAFRARLRGYGMTPNDAPELLWNFEKFLIARDGTVAARFAPSTAPDDPALVAAIEAELAK